MHHRTFCTCSPRSVSATSSFSVALRCTFIVPFCHIDTGLYAVDLLVRLYARFACSKVTALTREVGGLVRIDFDNSKLPGLQNYVSGQFVRVCFPTLNSFEWHPFTICGTRCKGSSTILISPVVQGPRGMRLNDWSDLVCRKACVGMPISIDGAFGAGLSFEPNDMDVVICFVGGSGISLGLNVANCVNSKSTHVILFWSVRCADHNKTLSCLSDLPSKATIVIYNTHLSSTQKSEDKDDKELGHCGVSPAGKSEVVTMFRRISFRDRLSAIEHSKGGKLGIAICGGAKFSEEAYKASCEYAALNPSAEVSISIESFAL